MQKDSEEEKAYRKTMFRLRAYCSVNYKLMSQVALDTLAESARRIAAHDYKRFYKIFESCSGKFSDRDNNLWVVDADGLLQSHLMENYINGIRSRHDPVVIFTMPTKSGYHLICHPFDEKLFKKGFREYFGDEDMPDIKKNHLTLLYENL